MTIAFDAKRYFNNATGLGFYSRTLLEGLRRFYPQHQYLLYTPYNHGNWAKTGDEIRLPDRSWARTFHAAWRSSGIAAQLQREGVKIFHGLSHELPLGLSRAGIRSTVTVHDLIFCRYPQLYPAIDRFFYTKKYRHAAETADCVVAISQQTKADLEEFFRIAPERVRVIGQACDPVFEEKSLRHVPERLALPLPGNIDLPSADFLISVGSLSPRKNWHTLLQALFLLKNNGIDLPLVAVGSGKSPYAKNLRAQARNLGLQVFWMGYLPSEQLALLYRRALGLVYPSIFEGFGIPILEAQTVGIPVVTSRGGCFEEVGGSAALYADSARAEDLAEQILRLFDAELRMQLTAAIPVQIARFSPEKISADWMEVYESLHNDHQTLRSSGWSL